MTKPFEETEDFYIVDIERECGSCKGTGLYVGMAERDGAAVVCHTCKGSGKVSHYQKHPKFKGRKKRDGVERVFHTASGYGIVAHDVTVEKTGETLHFSRFGCTYEDWLKGAKPKPIEELHCPYQHTNQGMQSSDHPANALYKERCNSGLYAGMWIPECKLRSDMATCWKQYHELVEEE